MSMIVAGSTCANRPITFNSTSDLPIWAALFTTTFSTPGSVNAFITSTMYGTRDDRQRPGSALALGSTRYRSAHVDTLNFSIGLSPRFSVRRCNSSLLLIHKQLRFVLR